MKLELKNLQFARWGGSKFKMGSEGPIIIKMDSSESSWCKDISKTKFPNLGLILVKLHRVEWLPKDLY